ncbi:MAG: diguanylate cyclase domain-containing protein [Actinomycetota bacterium]
MDQILAIAQQIHHSLDLGNILDTVLREIREILRSDRALIYCFLPDGDGVVLQESVSPEWTPIQGQLIYDPCFNAYWAEQYQQGRISILEDIDAKPLEPCYKELLIRLQVQANVVVPILTRNQQSQTATTTSPHLWGLLIVHQCSGPRQWEPLEIKILQLMVIQLGIALERVELCQQVRQLTQNLERQAQQRTQELKSTAEILYQRPQDFMAMDIALQQGRSVEIPEGQSVLQQCQQVEQELCWKETLLQSMTDSSPLAFYVVDNRTDTILYFNHRFCEIWGIEHLEEQMRQGKLKNNDIIPDCISLILDVPAFAESCKPLQSEENRCTLEDEIAFVDGRTIRRFSSQIRDRADWYFGRLYIFEDITDRKQAEEALRESEEHYRSVIAAMAEGVVLQRSTDGRITTFNESAKRILGLTSEQLMERTSQDLRWRAIHEDGSPFQGEDHPAMVTLRTGEPQFNVVMGVHKPDGSLIWISINSQPLFHLAQSQPYAVVTSFTEITASKLAEQALRQQTEREQMIYAIAQRIRQSLELDEILNTTVAEVQQFLQTDRVIIYRFNLDWSGVVVKESVVGGWLSILNMEITDTYFVESQGQPYQQNTVKATSDIYTAGFSPCHIQLLERLQVRAKLVVPILQSVSVKKNTSSEITSEPENRLWGLLVAHHCSAPRDWHSLEIELLKQLAMQVAIAIQQSELHQQLQFANQQLRNLAMIDPLTQLANRRYFDEHFHQTWRYLLREQQPLSLLLCDIDYFKQYNDTYGHAAGDICLTLVAQALRQTVQRSTDLVARYGGEEFVVILPKTDRAGAISVAQKIQIAIQELQPSHFFYAKECSITLSIGIATVIPRTETTPLALIEAADRALYKAKAKGRNCWFMSTTYSPNFY